MKPTLLMLIHLNETSRTAIEAAFDVVYATDSAQRTATITARGDAIRAVLTNGGTGLTAAEIDQMPALEFISVLGAGYENVAVEHARSRNIAVVSGAGTNASCVADHAFALLLAVVRDVPQLDQATRLGAWRDNLPMQPNVSGKRLGIVGLGSIGEKIARRGEGFEMEIGYHNRKPREGSALRYFDSVEALAQWCDFLIVATPGGAGTHHLIDRKVLTALGAGGFVVNVSRGSVVDTAALAQALTAGTIAGAGLDVYESEPHPPEALLALRNVVLTPHLAGRSPEASKASVDNFLANAERHFAGEALLTPI